MSPASHSCKSSIHQRLIQVEIIDDLAHLVDKTDDRIRNETRRVKLVETKSASCETSARDDVTALLKSPLGARDAAGGRSPQALWPHFNSCFLQCLCASSHRSCGVPCRYTRGAPRPPTRESSGFRCLGKRFLTSERSALPRGHDLGSASRLFQLFLLRHVLKAVFILFPSAGEALSEVNRLREGRAVWPRTRRGMRELQFAQ
ncbi:Syntaxin-8 [Liparis tanakae]|uniref:Syntaxin-8 n=1 Tax=Liparis tanakae TaxID=230148 RepID=A0A4Z2GRH1_9TELE|nr:Syntaxin-8 [Liparis tanakae]